MVSLLRETAPMNLCSTDRIWVPKEKISGGKQYREQAAVFDEGTRLFFRHCFRDCKEDMMCHERAVFVWRDPSGSTRSYPHNVVRADCGVSVVAETSCMNQDMIRAGSNNAGALLYFAVAGIFTCGKLIDKRMFAVVRRLEQKCKNGA